MKKILIVSYYYKHKNAMASVRAIKLSKYLSRLDCEVTVLTSYQKDTWTKQYIKPIEDTNITELYAPQILRWTLISNYLQKRKTLGTEKKLKENNQTNVKTVKKNNIFRNIKSNFIKNIAWLFYYIVSVQEDVCMFKGLKSEFKRQGRPHFDTVIATYPTFGALKMGMWMKKYRYCDKFIADFRDPLYNPGFRDKKIESNYDKKCLLKVVKMADQIVCVSEGISNSIIAECENLLKDRPIIITNGYDLEDVPLTIYKNNRDSKFKFLYTGTLYHGKRCVNMLAEVLRSLINEGELFERDFSFEYAGPDYNELLRQLSEFGLENTAINHGFVSREESIELQAQSQALLLLTWNEKNYQGVVPGKLFEYMAIRTVPIIALITGDVENSEVSGIIKETSSGFSCEQANKEDLLQLKKYVLNLIKYRTKINPHTEKYDYQEISRIYKSKI